MRAKIITLKRARNLRGNLTEPEVLLWARLREREPRRPVFRRQHAIGAYILDFYCPAAKLAVEVDGAGHGLPEQAAHDQRRDAWLKSQGITVHRVQAVEVLRDSARVADALRRMAEQMSARCRPLRQPLSGG